MNRRKNGVFRRGSGFTLVELMVTLAIGAILVAAAAPAFTETIRNSRLAAEINEVVYALNLARSEAVKRGTQVTLCKSTNNTSCAASADSWNSGWMVFMDRDGDGVIEASDADLNGSGTLDTGEDRDGDGALDADDARLKVAPSTVRPGFNLWSTYDTRVTYRATGDVTGTGRFVLCEGTDKTRARAVFISSAGRIRLAQDTNGNKIPEDSAGADIASCISTT